MATDRGFTLIEVLVALLVVAIGMTALVRNLGQAALLTDDLRIRTLAHWVAMNQAVAWSIWQPWPATGEQAGEEEMGGQRWLWRVRIAATNDEMVRQWSIRVMDGQGREVGHLTSYLGKPNPPPREEQPPPMDIPARE